LGGSWQGKPVTGYAEHIQRKLEIPILIYREQVAGRFDIQVTPRDIKGTELMRLRSVTLTPAGK
jgi:hypothetical protein